MSSAGSPRVAEVEILTCVLPRYASRAMAQGSDSRAARDGRTTLFASPRTMFIQPKAEFKAGYKCSTNACKDATGASTPCMDEDGKPIADQSDTVF